MNEPCYESYEINTLDIWYYEKYQYLSEGTPDEDIRLLKDRLEELIIYTNKWQKEEGNQITVEPFSDLARYDSGEHKGYYERHLRDWQEAKTLRERIILAFFSVNDEFFSLLQTIYVSPSHSNFDYWLALKLSQYEKGLKYISKFCEYNLKHIYDNDFEKFKGLLEVSIRQYKNNLISENISFYVEHWIKDYESNSQKNKIDFPKKTWKYETFVDEQVFEINEDIEETWDHSKNTDNTQNKEPETQHVNQESKVEDSSLGINIRNITNKLETSYRTFFLSALVKNRSIFDTENGPFMELSQLFDGIKNEFIYPGTTYKQFMAIFQEADIKIENRIVWIGTYYELYSFIKAIEEAYICQHLKDKNKWLIAQLCFKYHTKKGKSNGQIIEITDYKKISDASGDKSHNTDKLEDFVLKLKALCDETPTGEKNKI